MRQLFKYIKVITIMDNTCRICLDDDKEVPLNARCGCSSGFFHDECFIKWISRKPSMNCEVCKTSYQGVFVQIGAIRAYSRFSYKFFVLILNMSPLISIMLWISYKSLNDLVICNKNDEFCGNYEGFLFVLLSFNCFIVFLIFSGYKIFKSYPKYSGLIIDAPICRILLTKPMPKYSPDPPIHPPIEDSDADEQITIHRQTRETDIAHVIIDTSLNNNNENSVISIDDYNTEEESVDDSAEDSTDEDSTEDNTDDDSDYIPSDTDT